MHRSVAQFAMLFKEVYHNHSPLKNQTGLQIFEHGAGEDETIKGLFGEYEYHERDMKRHPDTDPYNLPYADASMDIVVSTSVFEHDDFFWLSFNEIMRILKPHGVFLLMAPSQGSFHRWPTDSWRFYPDAGRSMVKWAHRNGLNTVEMLESFTGDQFDDSWNDFVSVFIKDVAHAGDYQYRMQDHINWSGFTNGLRLGSGTTDADFANFEWCPEDQRWWRKGPRAGIDMTVVQAAQNQTIQNRPINTTISNGWQH